MTFISVGATIGLGAKERSCPMKLPPSEGLRTCIVFKKIATGTWHYLKDCTNEGEAITQAQSLNRNTEAYLHVAVSPVVVLAAGELMIL